jgi:hypothetical protein
MAKKIQVVGAKPKKITIVDQPKRRIDPSAFAAALGAQPGGLQVGTDVDPVALAELGTQLRNRLRSSGGRPALEDATVNCRVPLSAEDVKTLETLVAQIEGATGAKPSVGQLASVIVRLHLSALKSPPASTATDVSKQDMGPAVSMSLLQRIIDEQINPLREQVERLEAKLRNT